MHKTLVIAFSLFTAILLMLMPLSQHMGWFRPSWVLLMLIYWSIATSYRNGLVTAWCTGILLDFLVGTVIGEHAFALTLVSYCVAKLHLRLRMFPVMQQAMSVLLFVFFYQFILYCIQGFQGEHPGSYQYWFASLTSMMVWPVFFLMMQSYRKRFKIA